MILGGGRKYMTPAGTPDPEYPNEASENGMRKDMVNLIDTWLQSRQVGDVEGDSPLPTAPPRHGARHH